MPILDALALLPQSHKWIKDAIMERIQEVQGMVVQVQEENQAEKTNLHLSGQLDTPTRVQPSPVEKAAAAKEKKAPFVPPEIMERIQEVQGMVVVSHECSVRAEAEAKKAPIIPPAYVPKLPFPGRRKKELIEECTIELERQLLKVKDVVFLTKALKLVPRDNQRMTDAVLERIKEIQSSEEAPNAVSTEIPTRVIHLKLDDPGSFTLPCSLGHLTFQKSLCDLGASVSLMPLSVAQRLGFNKYKPSKVSLMLADRSIRHPYGLLEDVPVRIGHVEVPTDFVVLDMDEEPSDPLILGRPFLATAGALIDVKSGKIDLDFGEGLVLKFKITKAVQRPTIEGQLFSIEDEEPATGNLLQPALNQIHPESSVTEPTPAITPPSHSDSIETHSVILEFDQRRSKEWVELKERSKWQDQTIRSLMNTVKELTSKVKELQGDMEVWHSELLRESAKFGTQVERESDYPPDQAEFGIEEENIEKRCSNLSREDAEFEDIAERGTKRTLEPLQKTP